MNLTSAQSAERRDDGPDPEPLALQPVPERARSVIIGEALVDVFPDGSRRLGGAPFNVACHLAGLGLDPLLVTRVGQDADGARVLATMKEWGMDTSGVQLDPELATGEVKVTIEGGQPSFDIVANRAWDRIDPVTAAGAAARADGLLYHGSLACRSPVTAAAVEALRARSPERILVDLNLRDPYWSAKGVARLLTGAHWIKLNQDELERVVSGGRSLSSKARRLIERTGCEVVLVTRGERGALAVLRDGGELAGVPVSVDEVVDTVGAGDAFTAVVVMGLTRSWPFAVTLPRALELASAVCAVQGAVLDDRASYRRLLERWEAES